MTIRKECAGCEPDHSDRCDLYDSENYCRWYGDTWLCEKDGKMHGGMNVELITYCTKRRIKGKKINWGTNPLIMERLLMWNEVVFCGEIRLRHNDFYNPNGIIVWGDDGRMEDPVTGTVRLKDGTILTKDEYWRTTPHGKEMLDMFERIKKKENNPVWKG